MDKEKFIETYINNININEKIRKDAQEYLERKAISYAYKKMLSRVNKKMVEANRKYPNNSSKKLLLILGFDIFNLFLEHASFANDEPCVKDMMIWGMPILVSCNEDIIDVVCSGRNVSDGFFPTGATGLNQPLVNIEQLIEELPEDGKGKYAQK